MALPSTPTTAEKSRTTCDKPGGVSYASPISSSTLYAPSEKQETLQLSAVRRRAAPVYHLHLRTRARRRGADATRLSQPEARAHHRHLAVVADEHRGGTEHARGDARDVPLARHRDDDQKHHRVLAPRKPIFALHHPLVQERRPDEQKQTPDERLGDVRERRGAHEQRTDVRQSARDPGNARTRGRPCRARSAWTTNARTRRSRRRGGTTLAAPAARVRRWRRRRARWTSPPRR